MTSCFVPCDRSFSNQKALLQHKRDSTVHEYDCTTCDRYFSSEGALKQHLRNSPAHAPTFNCEDCDRSFSREEALDQHLRDSPAHAPTFNCEDCDRSFSSEEALEQHLRDSPAHAPTFNCEDCDRSFSSEEALEQHLRDSPAHAPTFNCEDCDRSFSSEEALDQHLRDSPVHQLNPETPLDTFFRSFPTFDYDPSLPAATSYANLRRLEGWGRGSKASDDAWDRYQDALECELRKWYGAENDITAWHALCRAIGVEPPPQTCEQCESAVRKVFVNIVDLIDWGRQRGNKEEPVQAFPSLVELRVYTNKTGKVFRNRFDQEDDNVVLRHLLRKLFRGSF